MDENRYSNGEEVNPNMEYQAPVYAEMQQQAPYQNNDYRQELDEPMTIGDWLLTTFLLAIPCVGLILCFVWGFSSTEKKTKANYCKAMLIWKAIGIVLSIVYIIFMVSMFGALGASILG